MYHHPIDSKLFGNVLNPLPNEIPDPRSIKFGQSSVNDIFSNSGKLGPKRMLNEDGEIVGKPLRYIINDLKSGKLSPDQFRVKVFKYKDKSGRIHWVTANNRNLTVLRAAGLEPTNIKILSVNDLKNAKGPDNLESVLNRLVSMPNELPSNYSFIRGEGLNSAGVHRISSDWDAPFVTRIGHN